MAGIFCLSSKLETRELNELSFQLAGFIMSGFHSFADSLI